MWNYNLQMLEKMIWSYNWTNVQLCSSQVDKGKSDIRIIGHIILYHVSIGWLIHDGTGSV